MRAPYGSSHFIYHSNACLIALFSSACKLLIELERFHIFRTSLSLQNCPTSFSCPLSFICFPSTYEKNACSPDSHALPASPSTPRATSSKRRCKYNIPKCVKGSHCTINSFPKPWPWRMQDWTFIVVTFMCLSVAYNNSLFEEFLESQPTPRRTSHLEVSQASRS